MSLTLLFWSALNLKLSWAKGARGPAVDWIGATLRVLSKDGIPEGVSLSVMPDKISGLTEKINAFSGPLVERSKVRDFAGFTSWIGSVIPAFRPYAQMVWAGAMARPSGRESEEKVSLARLSLAFEWMAAFASMRFSSIARVFPLVTSRRLGPIVTFDASLDGGGATLHYTGEAEAPDEFCATVWGPEDLRALGVIENGPQFQPLWEAYMLLIALKTWSHLLMCHSGRIRIHGDAKGVLQSVVYGRAKQPALNLIVAEMQLVLGGVFHDLRAAHFWSEENDVCDDLSRLHQGVKLPSILENAKHVSAKRNRWLLITYKNMRQKLVKKE